MEFFLSIFHFEFPLFFVFYLIIVYLIGALIKKMFKSSWFIFRLQYIAVWIHEVCHYFAAMACLKWPKFNKIVMEKKGRNYRISGSVSIKVFKYKDLIFDIVSGRREVVVSVIYLFWEIIAGFIIGLAPIIFPFIFTYFVIAPYIGYDMDMLASLVLSQYTFYLPVFAFFAQVSNLSKEDIKHALPGIVLLIFIPLPDKLSQVLVINLCIMFTTLVALFGLHILSGLNLKKMIQLSETKKNGRRNSKGKDKAQLQPTGNSFK